MQSRFSFLCTSGVLLVFFGWISSARAEFPEMGVLPIAMAYLSQLKPGDAVEYSMTTGNMNPGERAGLRIEVLATTGSPNRVQWLWTTVSATGAERFQQAAAFQPTATDSGKLHELARIDGKIVPFDVEVRNGQSTDRKGAKMPGSIGTKVLETKKVGVEKLDTPFGKVDAEHNRVDDMDVWVDAKSHLVLRIVMARGRGVLSALSRTTGAVALVNDKGSLGALPQQLVDKAVYERGDFTLTGQDAADPKTGRAADDGFSSGLASIAAEHRTELFHCLDLLPNDERKVGQSWDFSGETQSDGRIDAKHIQMKSHSFTHEADACVTKFFGDIAAKQPRRPAGKRPWFVRVATEADL